MSFPGRVRKPRGMLKLQALSLEKHRESTAGRGMGLCKGLEARCIAGTQESTV